MQRYSPRKRAITPYLFLLPAMLLYICFSLVPTASTVIFSFFEWDSFMPTDRFAGLQHYAYVLRDPYFWAALKNNLIFLGLAVIIPVVLGFFIAVLISEVTRGRIVYRTLTYFPVVFAGVTVAFLWLWIYHPFVGLLNGALDAIGLSGLKQSWLGNSHIVLYSCFVAYAWSSVGNTVIIYLAGIQGLDPQCYEAALLDGAGFWTKMTRITLPMLRETSTFVVSLRILSAMAVFDIVYNMTAGGPNFASNVIGIYIYNMLNNMKMGWGSSAAVINAIIVVSIHLGYMKFRERKSSYE